MTFWRAKTPRLQGIERSALFTGWLRHRRFVPLEHHFSYPLFMYFIDLDELEQVISSKWYCSLERVNIVSFYRRDFLGGTDSNETQSTAKTPTGKLLKDAVKLRVMQHCEGHALAKPDIQRVCMLTQLRFCNMLFNPVSFYYCFDGHDKLSFIVAEITNTPWGERHAYVLPVGTGDAATSYQARGKQKHQFEFAKAFHVSPFNPMNMAYRWCISEPGGSCQIHMENMLEGAEEGVAKHFDATLVMRRRSLVSELGKTLIQMPFLSVKVVWGIYWQAFKLWCKKAPFYDHPNTLEKSGNDKTTTAENKA